MNIKIVSFALIIVLILNISLFATKRINELLFWAVIIVIAVFAYKILPKIKK